MQTCYVIKKVEYRCNFNFDAPKTPIAPRDSVNPNKNILEYKNNNLDNKFELNNYKNLPLQKESIQSNTIFAQTPKYDSNKFKQYDYNNYSYPDFKISNGNTDFQSIFTRNQHIQKTADETLPSTVNNFDKNNNEYVNEYNKQSNNKYQNGEIDNYKDPKLNQNISNFKNNQEYIKTRPQMDINNNKMPLSNNDNINTTNNNKILSYNNSLNNNKDPLNNNINKKSNGINNMNNYQDFNGYQNNKNNNSYKDYRDYRDYKNKDLKYNKNNNDQNNINFNNNEENENIIEEDCLLCPDCLKEVVENNNSGLYGLVKYPDFNDDHIHDENDFNYENNNIEINNPYDKIFNENNDNENNKNNKKEVFGYIIGEQRPQDNFEDDDYENENENNNNNKLDIGNELNNNKDFENRESNVYDNEITEKCPDELNSEVFHDKNENNENNKNNENNISDNQILNNNGNTDINENLYNNDQNLYNNENDNNNKKENFDKNENTDNYQNQIENQNLDGNENVNNYPEYNNNGENVINYGNEMEYQNTNNNENNEEVIPEENDQNNFNQNEHYHSDNSKNKLPNTEENYNNNYSQNYNDLNDINENNDNHPENNNFNQNIIQISAEKNPSNNIENNTELNNSPLNKTENILETNNNNGLHIDISDNNNNPNMRKTTEPNPTNQYYFLNLKPGFVKCKHRENYYGNNVIIEEELGERIDSFQNNNVAPIDEYSKYIFDAINGIRSNPQYFANIIKDAMKKICVSKNGNMLYYKGKQKIGLYKGKEAFENAIYDLNKTKQMNPLFFCPNISIPLPDNENDINDKNYMNNKINEIMNNGINIISFWKNIIEDPEDCLIMMIVDDNANEGLKRKDILDPNMKYIGISTVKIGKSFANYITLSDKKDQYE